MILFSLNSCGHISAGSGHVRLMNYQCEPVENTSIVIINHELNKFLSAGHVSRDEYISKDDGSVDFNIEKSADNVKIYQFNTDTKKLLFLRKFTRVNGATGIGNLLKTTYDKPVALYIKKSDRELISNNIPEVDAFWASFESKVARGLFRHENSALLHYRIYKDNNINSIKLDAIKGGDFAEIVSWNNNGIIIGKRVNKITLIPNEQNLRYMYYVTFGSKKHAAIIVLRAIYDSSLNSITIKKYTRLVTLSGNKESSSILVNLEECGGEFDYGLNGYYTQIHVSDRVGNINRSTANRTTASPSDIPYIKTITELNELVNKADTNQGTFLEILPYNSMDLDVFKALYPIALKKNWSILADYLGENPRSNDSIIADIIKRLPLENKRSIKKLTKYIANPSAQKESISLAIRLFSDVKKSKYENKLFLDTLVKGKYIYNFPSAQIINEENQDIKVIQAYLESSYINLIDDNYKQGLSKNLVRNYYTSKKLLSLIYKDNINKSIYAKNSIIEWLNNQNTPASVISAIYNNDKSAVNIKRYLDHPNIDNNLRRRIYSKLDNEKFGDYYHRLAIAGSITTPEVIFNKFIIINKTNRLRHEVRTALLKNPSLPLELTEKLVGNSSCPVGINKKYAQAHFNSLPTEACSHAALLSKFTPIHIKHKIVMNFGISPRSRANIFVDLPKEKFNELYKNNSAIVSTMFAQNPYTPENILIDIFNNSHNMKAIEQLAANKSTPHWVLEKILDNNIVSDRVGPFGVIIRALSCNPKLPGHLKKQIKYNTGKCSEYADPRY